MTLSPGSDLTAGPLRLAAILCGAAATAIFQIREGTMTMGISDNGIAHK